MKPNFICKYTNIIPDRTNVVNEREPEKPGMRPAVTLVAILAVRRDNSGYETLIHADRFRPFRRAAGAGRVRHGAGRVWRRAAGNRRSADPGRPA